MTSEDLRVEADSNISWEGTSMPSSPRLFDQRLVQLAKLLPLIVEDVVADRAGGFSLGLERDSLLRVFPRILPTRPNIGATFGQHRKIRISSCMKLTSDDCHGMCEYFAPEVDGRHAVGISIETRRAEVLAVHAPQIRPEDQDAPEYRRTIWAMLTRPERFLREHRDLIIDATASATNLG